MAKLTSVEKMTLEKFLGMSGGYVLDFTNRSFQEFVLDNVQIDIYKEKYSYDSGSKANRLRAFWDKEENFIVGKLIINLLDYWKAQKLMNSAEITPAEQDLFNECEKIAERLSKELPIENIDVLLLKSEKQDFSPLINSIKKSIENNQPEEAIDRLHTFAVKYVRDLCNRYGIDHDRNKPLHGMFGEYIKYLKRDGHIESQMTERILKSSIAIFEAFNDVRNNQSFAHDNKLLNYDESVLIANNLFSTLKFIEAIEIKIAGKTKKFTDEVPDFDMPPDWEVPF
ncbi:MAG: abortive infection family protein [Anaerolineales bacterium]